MGQLSSAGGFGRLFVGMTLGFLLGLASTVYADGHRDGFYRKLEVLAEVFAHVENHHVDALAPVPLVYGAAKGAVAMLDPHSAFFTPQEYRTLLDTTEGEYGGTGMALEHGDNGYVVVAVYDTSPAHRAGILVGDTLKSIDGDLLPPGSLDAVRQALRGRVGSRVTVGLTRLGIDGLQRYTLTRRWVRVAPVSFRRLQGGVAYVRVRSFARRVAADVAGVLSHQLERKDQEPPAGVVLDLRDNPGGLFDEAVALCDLFLRDGLIVATVGRGGRVVDRHLAQPSGVNIDTRLAVLINTHSASAAEVVAGALMDRGRARVFGQPSYGKGSVQSMLELSDGSGLKLTVGRYVTPAGRSIEGNGIAPDHAVSVPEGLAEPRKQSGKSSKSAQSSRRSVQGDASAGSGRHGGEGASPENDPTLQAAVEWLLDSA